MRKISMSLVILAIFIGLPIMLAAETPANPVENPCNPPDIDAHSSSAAIKTLINFNCYQARIDSEMGFFLERDNTGAPQLDTDPMSETYGQYKAKTEQEAVYPPQGEMDANPPADETGTPMYRITNQRMSLNYWKVRLNSSADTVDNRVHSYCRSVKTTDDTTVLGIRVHFPSHSYNAWASIKPPFEIKVYDELGNIINLENGVVNNTGIIRKLVCVASGRNYKNSLAVRLRDQNEDIYEFYLGDLFFSGWKPLTWANPNYIESIDHRELFRLPLYPQEIPHLVFDSFIFYRNGEHLGGDFVSYIKWVNIQYDLATEWPDPQTDVDIVDEDIWNILKMKAAEQAAQERREVAEYMDLLLTEERKQRRSEADGGNGGGGAPQPAPADDDTQ